jgi:zinc protease
MKIKNFRIRNIITGLMLLVFSAWILSFNISAQEEFSLNLEDPIPFDQQIEKGTFDNGLTYYIRENQKPENRAQFWLVVNAGSILEDKDQLGLAHFTEHMAFNGTKNFAKHEIVDYLESIGMQFGPEINAYTSFDETVYMLQVPTDSIPLVETAFQILEDWARYISFEKEEVEKERGVVIEEWRLGRGADGRMRDKQLPVIFKGSLYADRLPIGKKEIIETFQVETVKRFYNDWYRPDLMAVIAVGDFDQDHIEGLISEHFGQIPAAESARSRESYVVPDHEETLFAIATDPEAANTVVSIYYKMDPEPEKDINDYRRMLIERLNIRMMNNRFYELLNQPDPPFLFGVSMHTSLVRVKDIYLLGAYVKEDGIKKGLETLLAEAERVKKYGFTESELNRTKNQLLNEFEKLYNERDKTESQAFAGEYARNFLEREPVPGIEFEFAVAKELLPGIKLEEVNELIEQWMSDENRVVLVNAPERTDLKIPSEDELLAILNQIDKTDIEPYEDQVSDQPLVKNIPEPAQIIREKKIEDLNITEWTLSNGSKVVLKPTDFKNDEIQFYAFSPGGTSLISNEKYVSARAASDIISISGLGEFDLNALNKKIADKVVSVFPYINELNEGFVGNSTPKDLETLFQLVYLYMTAPRKDQDAFLSYQTRMKGFIQNRSADPESAFYDTLMVTMAQHHPRVKPWSEELLNELDLETTYHFYKERFADASDFTFLFVGNFKIERIKPLILTYLGGLPSTKREESWRDVGIRTPEGVIEKTVFGGIEPKSRISIIFSGPMEWSREENYYLKSMASILDIKLREVIREEMGGTYGVSVSSSVDIYPVQEYRVNISFGCDPERVEELTRSIFKVLDSLKTNGPEEIYITKVRETQLRSYEINLKENGFWINNLQNYYFTGRNPELILEYPKLVKTLDADVMMQTANKYLDMNNYVQVELMPEEI